MLTLHRHLDLLLLYAMQELALRDDTLLAEDAAGALHVALNRAAAWCRASASKAGLLAEAAVALEALASYEASYTYGEAAATQALSAAAQVSLAGYVLAGFISTQQTAPAGLSILLWCSGHALCSVPASYTTSDCGHPWFNLLHITCAPCCQHELVSWSGYRLCRRAVKLQQQVPAAAAVLYSRCVTTMPSLPT